MGFPSRGTILATICLAAICGCGDDDDIERVEPVALDQVPPAIMKAASDKLPDVKFDTALKGKVRGEDAYELRGKTKQGKSREVEVSLDGKVIGVE